MAVHDKLRVRLAAVVREFLVEEGLLREPGQAEQSLFATLEDAAMEVGDAVTREVLQQQLAAQPEAGCHCPTCGEAGLRKKERQRSIATRRGPVEVAEVECYCRRCRRSFRNAREVTLHVGQEHRHALGREAFRETLQGDGLAGPSRPGNQAVAVCPRQFEPLPLAVFGQADKDLTHLVLSGPTDGPSC